jgi:ligand-binding SRPBCC domain-containing protein
MPTFDYTFSVPAPLEQVAAFHYGTAVLKQLTPPPIYVQIREAQPLAEGSTSHLTLWFGPIPVHWVAIHSAVDPLRGFVDSQSRGPMKKWRHQHTFQAAGPGRTQVHEHLEYDHRPGLAGLFTRLLFNRPALTLLFSYRKWATRRAVAGATRTTR